MRLDRNVNEGGFGKYALIKLRALDDVRNEAGEIEPEVLSALRLLEKRGILDRGMKGTPEEFMVLRLKDQWAQAALDAYATKAVADDPEWAAEIWELAARSGPGSPWCKRPD